MWTNAIQGKELAIHVEQRNDLALRYTFNALAICTFGYFRYWNPVRHF